MLEGVQRHECHATFVECLSAAVNGVMFQPRCRLVRSLRRRLHPEREDEVRAVLRGPQVQLCQWSVPVWQQEVSLSVARV